MIKKIKIICKKSCESIGGKCIINEIYDCIILGNTYFISDKNNIIIRLEKLSIFSEFFYTEQEYRKLKLNKIYESR